MSMGYYLNFLLCLLIQPARISALDDYALLFRR